MPYPRKREIQKFDEDVMISQLTPEVIERYKGKSFDQVIAEMANSDSEKIMMAKSLLSQIKASADPSSIKILLAALEKQGYTGEKELPISDARYKEILKTAAQRI